MHKETGVVPVTEEFVCKHMRNGVVPRLLNAGGAPADGLGTAAPSRNKAGEYTIMCTLHIEASPFMHLLRFFRTGHLPASVYDKTKLYETSLRLGGFEALDARMREEEEQAARAARALPMHPREDTRGRFQWRCQYVLNHSAEIATLTEQGWTMTALDENNTVMGYFRRRYPAAEDDVISSPRGAAPGSPGPDAA